MSDKILSREEFSKRVTVGICFGSDLPPNEIEREAQILRSHNDALREALDIARNSAADRLRQIEAIGKQMREALAEKDRALSDMTGQRNEFMERAAGLSLINVGLEDERDEWKLRAETDTRLLDWIFTHKTGHICEDDGKFAFYDPQKKTNWFDTPREALSAMAAQTQEPL